MYVRLMFLRYVRNHLLPWRSTALFELLSCMIRFLPLGTAELLVEHLHRVRKKLTVGAEVRGVDVPENIPSVALGGEENKIAEDVAEALRELLLVTLPVFLPTRNERNAATGEIFVLSLIAATDGHYFAPPFLVFAGV